MEIKKKQNAREMVVNMSVLGIKNGEKMTNSLILKCKTCGTEEEIIGMSFEYYMLYYFIPNGVDEICENCGNESMVPVDRIAIKHCKYCGVKYCEYCCVKL